MIKYSVKITEIASQDLEKINSYLKYELMEDIIADKYKLLFKQKIKSLENVAGSLPVLDRSLTGHNDIRKINVRNYIVFYTIDKKNTVYILRIGHAFMDWEKYLKEK